MSKSRSSKTFLFLSIFAAFSGGLLLSWTLTEPAPEPISAHLLPPSPKEQAPTVIVEKAGLSDPALEVIAELRVQLTTLSLRLTELSSQQAEFSTILAQSLPEDESGASFELGEQDAASIPIHVEGPEHREKLSDAIEEHIYSGDPDEDWSNLARSEFERELTKRAVDSLEVGEVHCVEALCRIEFVIHDPIRAFHDTSLVMPKIFPWEAETFTVVGENDPSRVTLYAAREGYSLLDLDESEGDG